MTTYASVTLLILHMQMMFFGVTSLGCIAALLSGLDIGLSQTLALPKVSAVWARVCVWCSGGVWVECGWGGGVRVECGWGGGVWVGWGSVDRCSEGFGWVGGVTVCLCVCLSVCTGLLPHELL